MPRRRCLRPGEQGRCASDGRVVPARLAHGPGRPGPHGGVQRAGPAPGAAVAVRTWSPGDADDGEPLPLIVAHDGPEYDTQARLTQYLAAGVTSGRLPRLRAALLAPGSPGQIQRDQWYSASASYTRALALTVLPALAGGWRSPRGSGWGPAWAPWRCCTPTAATRPRSTRCSCSRAASSARASIARSRTSATTAGWSGSWPACMAAGCGPPDPGVLHLRPAGRKRS